jgi:hypothetical protein
MARDVYRRHASHERSWVARARIPGHVAADVRR